MEQATINFDSPHLLSDEEAVLSCLVHGRESAVSSTIIEARTGLRPRRVQQIIRKLRLEGHSIGSATQEPMGYYITDEQGDNVRETGWRRLERGARPSRPPSGGLDE